jgi:hypothetical protein
MNRQVDNEASREPDSSADPTSRVPWRDGVEATGGGAPGKAGTTLPIAYVRAGMASASTAACLGAGGAGGSGGGW